MLRPVAIRLSEPVCLMVAWGREVVEVRTVTAGETADISTSEQVYQGIWGCELLQPKEGSAMSM